MSETYVRRLFDQYAARYDTALTERLAYRGPALLRQAVEAAMQAVHRPLHFGSMLDLRLWHRASRRRLSLCG